MKPPYLLLLIASLYFTSCEEDTVYPAPFYECQTALSGQNDQHPSASTYQNLADGITAQGVPGIMLSVRDQSGLWSGASGLADLANETPMMPCQISRVGSTVKTFTAVTILLLQRDGKLDLDDPVKDYLDAALLKDLANAQDVSLRQLLQHSSGIPNYIVDLRFQTASLNDLEKEWTRDELMDYARNKPADFAPNADVQYSNTNYILLGEVISAVEGKPFYEVFDQRIFQPLDLKHTQFASTDPVPEGIVRGYVDLYSNMNLINSTYYSGWDYHTADGGLISNAHDLNRFMDALFNGSFLQPDELKEMLAWKEPAVTYEGGFSTGFGLGIFKIETDFGPAYLHSGDAIGYFASMVHFPEQNVTVTWAVNGNYGALDEFSQSKEAMEHIFRSVLK